MANPATTADALAIGLPVAGGAAVLTVALLPLVLRYLRHRQIMCMPNERSSHTLPTPRGGGLATTPVMALALLPFGLSQAGILALGAVLLLVISWWDDRHGLPALPRFGTHVAVIAAFLALLPADTMVFGGILPVWADRVLSGLCWLWFVNLYNFMDGIDGITGVETLCVGGGIALVAALGAGASLLVPSLAVAAVGAAFLLFNWHPAKLFLGDSGSVPFGYVLGGMLLLLAADGHLAAALILPAYYLADSTITLGRRALNGEKIWQAHRKHFYQRAVQGGKRHDQVSLAVLGGNLLLVACTVWSLTAPWPATACAALVVAAMLALFQKWSKGAGV